MKLPYDPGKPYIETDSLPKLCSVHRCREDRVFGESVCRKHWDAQHKNEPGIDGWPGVYAIRALDLVKFGVTSSIKSRLANIRGDSPAPVELLGIIHAPFWLEKSIHRAMKAHHHHGEWFAWNDDTHGVAIMIQQQDIDGLRRIASIEPGRRYPTTGWKCL